MSGIMEDVRADRIRERLRAHWQNLGVATAIPEPVQWGQMMVDAPILGRFGWFWPFLDDERGWFIVPFCPEIIDEQTAHLDEADLDKYLTTIEWMVDTYVGHWNDGLDNDQLAALVEDELLNEAPGSMALVNDVQAHALDTEDS